MQCGKFLTLFAAIVMLVPLSAWAREKNEGTLQLFDVVEIGSTQLQPGTYKVEWNGNGPEVQVNVLQGKKTVATTSAKLQTSDRPAPQDAVTVASNGQEKQVTEIDFGNRKEALLLNSSGMNR